MKDWEKEFDEKFGGLDVTSQRQYSKARSKIEDFISQALSSQLKEVLERLRKNIKDNLVVESSIVKDVLSLVEMKIDQAEAELSQLAEVKEEK